MSRTAKSVIRVVDLEHDEIGTRSLVSGPTSALLIYLVFAFLFSFHQVASANGAPVGGWEAIVSGPRRKKNRTNDRGVYKM